MICSVLRPLKCMVEIFYPALHEDILPQFRTFARDILDPFTSRYEGLVVKAVTPSSLFGVGTPRGRNDLLVFSYMKLLAENIDEEILDFV